MLARKNNIWQFEISNICPVMSVMLDLITCSRVTQVSVDAKLKDVRQKVMENKMFAPE